jgi:hypothetical protein
VALFNGPEGDVSPAWKFQDRRDTVHLGEILQQEILAAAASAAKAAPLEPRISTSFDWVPLPGARLSDRSRVAEKPMGGAGALGGAEDGRTLFYDLGWKEGVTRPDRDPAQGFKHPGIDFRLDPMVLPWYLRCFLPNSEMLIDPDAVPSEAPLGILRFGSITLVTLPGEWTTLAGRRLRKAVDAAGIVIAVGLANEYMSYFATPEEYEAQHYEGASTLYGPRSVPFLTEKAAALARDSVRREPGAREFKYHPGSVRRFTGADVGARPIFAGDGYPSLLIDLATGDPTRSFPHWEWEDGLPDLTDPKRSTLPRVRIQVPNPAAPGGWEDFKTVPITGGAASVEDNAGTRFLTVLLEADKEKTRWSAHWMRDQAAKPIVFRFAVESLDGSKKYSESMNHP